MIEKLITFITAPKTQLFLSSFAILFLELALIRFVPAYVRYLGYFTNFILLGAFLGIGVGCLVANSKRNIGQWFPFIFLLLIVIIHFFKFEVEISTNQVVYFKSNTENSLVQSYIVLPGIFLVVTLLFATLSQKLGRLLSQFNPLMSYTIDIIGSIFGILTFTLCSFLSLGPIVWFSLFFLMYIFLVRIRWVQVVSLFVLGVTFLFIQQFDTLPTFWSPYQKISPYSVSNPRNEPDKPYDQWRLYVNNISHQEMTPFARVDPFYVLPYKAYPETQFAEVLIVGAGSGQDVNVALHLGATHVDAVEIDPVIANLGKKLHPENPYADGRVTLIINDARSFLENTHKQYDLIIFALPDSTVLSTSMSSLRLESYLFTQEAFAAAKEHLKPEGVFSLYNFYRTQWLVDKIGYMLTQEFGYAPAVMQYQDNLAVFVTGPKLAKNNAAAPFAAWQGKDITKAATDDWPFLYLRSAQIPNVYLKSLLIIAAIASGLVLLVTRGKILQNFAGDFFFLGVAFLLIETKSIINFNLLFGSTWLVNSLVFVGMLMSVLLAIWINQKWQIKNILLLMVLLFMALFVNYLVPTRLLLVSNIWMRFLLAICFFFSPITLANIVFSHLFKKTKTAADSFGINLLGAVMGGGLEYVSLLFGYRNLILIAIVLYACAFLFVLRRRRFALRF